MLNSAETCPGGENLASVVLPRDVGMIGCGQVRASAGKCGQVRASAGKCGQASCQVPNKMLGAKYGLEGATLKCN